MSHKGIKKEVKMYFVLPENCDKEDDVSNEMKMAFQDSIESGLCPKWIKGDECLLDIQKSKNVVFVLQEFKGHIFDKLRATKSLRVCGPMCLRNCLAESKPIPENKSPVFTTAMRDVFVTASQVTVEMKAQIKERVHFMGGVYLSNLAEVVTHLVTNAVRSAKYEAAGERGLPIMTVQWVEAVWEESQKRNIKATDPDIMAKFKCPIFYNMFITCSNISKSEKEKIKQLVTENGGKFTATMRQSETTLLVVREPRGEKYTHARSWDLPCVNPSYIYESIEKGYAVPSKNHLVLPSVKCSTPTKEDDIANFTYNSDPSISVINFETNKTHVEDSQMTTFTQLGSQQKQLSNRPENHYTQILKGLTFSEAKKAGSFVDGCKVYLSGFSAVDTEKLRRILSLGGATIFSEITDSVSHMILGEFLVEDMKALSKLIQKPHVVSLEWVVASIKEHSPAAEEPFYCIKTPSVVPEPPSPLSQKGVQLLKPPSEDSETLKMPPPAQAPQIKRKLLSEFLEENAKIPLEHNQNTKNQNNQTKNQNEQSKNQDDQTLNSTTSSSISGVPDLFMDKKFLILGYTSDVSKHIEDVIVSAGGSVVTANFKGVADYAIVPMLTPIPNVTALEVVTELWLDDCIYDSKDLAKIEYYHQPISVDSKKKPLSGVCLTFSNYFNKEKIFLSELAKVLGAVTQDVLARTARKDMGAIPSTHLVCPKPEGSKFNAACKWGLPIVTKDWLLSCARSGTKVEESLFFVTKQTDTTTNSFQQKANLTRSTVESHKSNIPVTAENPNPSTSNISTPCTSSKSPSVNLSMTDHDKTPLNSNPDDSICGKEYSFFTPAIPHPTVNSLKRRSTANTPEELSSPFHVSTPDSPYGQAIATPTADGKKRWKRFIDDLPNNMKTPAESPKPSSRKSTPLSELKRRIWAKALETSNASANYSIEEVEEEPSSDLHPTPSGALLRQETDLKNLKDYDQTSLRTPIRNPESASTTPCQKSKGIENMRPRKVSLGRATPSVSDFKVGSNTPVSQAKNTDIPRQSSENEKVCLMLDELNQKLTTSSQAPKEDKPLPKWKDRDYSNQTPPTSNNKPAVTRTVLDPESQPVEMGWEDPVEAAERAKVLGPQQARKFALSNVNDKEAYEIKLSSLGESVSSQLEYEKEVTHLIVDKPVRSEKLLCCLAGAKWILHTSFIDHIAHFGTYVPEEEKFEWGNPLSAETIPMLTPRGIEYQLAAAAHRWRKELGGKCEGAFQGMKAIIITTPNKIESYKRLINAGGGEVLDAKISSLEKATICFMEPSKVDSFPVPLTEFVAYKVPCVPPIFLSELLTKCPAPNPMEALIPEYRKLMQSNFK